MTLRAPRAISIENHQKKKVPCEGRTRQIDRPGKTRSALLETRSVKSMQANDRIHNVSNKSENSDSKYFNLGELSFTELLQSLTYLLRNQAQKERQHSSKGRSSQVYLREANKEQMPPRKQLIRMNCRMKNFQVMQTDLRRNFFQYIARQRQQENTESQP